MIETKLFRRANKRSKKWGETNDCTVIALAIATGKTYEVAHGALALRGRFFPEGHSHAQSLPSPRRPWVRP